MILIKKSCVVYNVNLIISKQTPEKCAGGLHVGVNDWSGRLISCLSKMDHFCSGMSLMWKSPHP